MNLFGTDGIRGNASKFPFDNVTLRIIGKSIAETIKCKKAILIRDTRESGIRIQEELAKGLMEAGVYPTFGGIMPTSAASLFTKNQIFHIAIVISASHNPYYDNGIKIFNSEGFKLTNFLESKIEKKINYYLSLKKKGNYKYCKNKIKVKEDTKLLNIYEKFVVSNFFGNNLSNKKIVIDCANGASFKCAENIFSKLGAKVIVLNNKPNGKNINLRCGAIYPYKVAKIVKEYKAFCGFAFDGDADRIVFIDENGAIKDGDYFLSSIAIWLKQNKKLKHNIIVSSIISNTGFIKEMKNKNIKLILTNVGDKNISNSIRKYNASFGGENSGHFIFMDLLPTGDGLLSATILLSILETQNIRISEFIKEFAKFPQVTLNKKISNKIPINKLKYSNFVLNKYKKELKNGRIIIRYSGTEALIRVMVEGENIQNIQKIAETIANTISNEINILKNK
ncbi:MAG: hypothetical protein LBL53_01115 [Endomicrobium sp.]|jgi:phosphoglucosamine mutase|nr:hypothetical protein [Endomicrobium sp.]